MCVPIRTVRFAAVTVSAYPDKELPSAAIHFGVEMRADPGVRAGTYWFEGEDIVTGWHHHHLHQLEYAFAGIAEVETAHGKYLLPPQQAAWIPSGLQHETTLRRVRSVSVFFESDMLEGPGDRVRILAAAPVIREMILYGTRWPIDRIGSDASADAYFEVLARVVADWLDHETPLCLPTSNDPIVSAAMEFTNANLLDVEESVVCRSIGVSARTLRRKFSDNTKVTWERYLAGARILRAMALLAESSDTVTNVSMAVGFDSLSSFTRAFRTYAGETPTAYRTRVRGG
jgi:AraC-like DNA-binding protein